MSSATCPTGVQDTERLFPYGRDLVTDPGRAAREKLYRPNRRRRCW